MKPRGGDVRVICVFHPSIFSDLLKKTAEHTGQSSQKQEPKKMDISSSAPFTIFLNYPDVDKCLKNSTVAEMSFLLDIEALAEDNDVPRSSNVILLGAAAASLGMT